MKDTPELLICVFPVDMPSYNIDATEVIKPKKDCLVALMCVNSHYTVCEVLFKERVIKISNGLDKPLVEVVPSSRISPEEDRSSTKGYLC